MNIVSSECWSLQGEICFYCWFTLKNWVSRFVQFRSVHKPRYHWKFRVKYSRCAIAQEPSHTRPNTKIALTRNYLDDFAVRMHVPRLSRMKYIKLYRTHVGA